MGLTEEEKYKLVLLRGFGLCNREVIGRWNGGIRNFYELLLGPFPTFRQLKVAYGELSDDPKDREFFIEMLLAKSNKIRVDLKKNMKELDWIYCTLDDLLFGEDPKDQT